MNALLIAAAPSVKEICSCMTFWAILVGGVGLWLLLPTRWRIGKLVGALLVAVAGGLVAYDLPRLGLWIDQGVFWSLTAITLGAAIATIASQSPVYSAIWFALSLLGTAGLFMFQGAQFLGGATVVVYAGAIVVTFLFVIMLAQPEGHSLYDRLTWGGLPKILGVVAACLLLGILTFMMNSLKREASGGLGLEDRASADTIDGAGRAEAGGVLDAKHVANLGGQLFSKHLISVEVAGTLLLVALVGAIAIAIQGKPRLAQRIEEALE
jgi:NADH-quinone oxidoreductase subunit J